jgi:hypothetical protein
VADNFHSPLLSFGGSWWCVGIEYWSTMVFYMIGLGLGDPEDISVKALKAIRSCK